MRSSAICLLRLTFQLRDLCPVHSAKSQISQLHKSQKHFVRKSKMVGDMGKELKGVLTDFLHGGLGELQDLHNDITVTKVLGIFDIVLELLLLGLSQTTDIALLFLQFRFQFLRETIDKFINSIFVLTIDKKLNDFFLGWCVFVVSINIFLVFSFLKCIQFLLEIILLFIKFLDKLALKFTNFTIYFLEKFGLILSHFVVKSRDLRKESIFGYSQCLLQLDFDIHEVCLQFADLLFKAILWLSKVNLVLTIFSLLFFKPTEHFFLFLLVELNQLNRILLGLSLSQLHLL